jgi:two-component system, NtrC family, response regulator AtoC
MNKNKALKLVKENEDQILSNWLSELDSNPNIPKESFKQKKNLKTYSKSFLKQLVTTFQVEDIPDLDQNKLRPIISVWHKLLQSQISQGFTTKETAMLIYALKASLKKLVENNENFNLQKDDMRKLEQLLDILGILTFEIYSVEKEKLITRQTKQIQYLQTNTKNQDQIIGASPKMKEVYKAVGLVLENDITVLVEGESGTGKDLIATIIHINSNRKNKPLIILNCGAIPKDITESELFGHEKGAFTGADERKLGKFELADGGTLFLDEVGELSLEIQVKLLRAIQNREIERVGGTQKIKINTRIIAATNKSLKQLVDNGKFRLDLYYRLNVFPIEVPALRDRKEDIIPLTMHFLEKYSKEFSLPEVELTHDAEQYLLNQNWEGNIRELENLIQRSLILSQGQAITSTIFESKPGQYNDHPLLLNEVATTPSVQLSNTTITTLDEVEKQAIKKALTIKESNMLQTAKSLGISRTTLYKKIEKYNIKV